jgi:O-methyltransferase involved in polyketide biosynthesis
VTDNPKGQDPTAQIDTTVPHSARVWNYLLGGTDNYPPDQAAGEMILRTFPDMARIARVQRSFLTRAVRYLAGEAGIRQFLDIGTGLPTADNTHEVAQRVAPDARIVYVDNDPLVLVQAHALLTSSPQGATSYIHADVRDPDKILAAAAETLDFTRPVALMMLSIMGQLPDSDEPKSIINRLLDALPPGSHLALSDGTNTSERLNEAVRAYNESSVHTYHLRSPERIAGFLYGLELVEPGVVTTSRWRPDGIADGTASEPVDAVCGVGRKP